MARGDSFLLRSWAGIEGLSRSPGHKAGEGRGHSQSLDTSSLLRRFLCRLAPRAPRGSQQAAGRGGGTEAWSPGAPRCHPGWRESGCPGKGWSGVSGVTIPRHPRGLRSGRPSAGGSEAGHQRRRQGPAPRRDPCGEGWEPETMQVKRGAPESGGEIRGRKPQSGGGGRAGPRTGMLQPSCPRRRRARGPAARTAPHPSYRPRSALPTPWRGEEEKPIWSQRWPLPASVAVGGAEDRLTEILNPCR